MQPPPCNTQCALVQISSVVHICSNTCCIQCVAMVQRVTYRRRHAYATKSNKTRIVRTPGGKLVVQYPKKKTSHPVCGVTGALLAGVRQSAMQALHCTLLHHCVLALTHSQLSFRRVLLFDGI